MTFAGEYRGTVRQATATVADLAQEFTAPMKDSKITCREVSMTEKICLQYVPLYDRQYGTNHEMVRGFGRDD